MCNAASKCPSHGLARCEDKIDTSVAMSNRLEFGYSTRVQSLVASSCRVQVRNSYRRGSPPFLSTYSARTITAVFLASAPNSKPCIVHTFLVIGAVM